MMSMLSNLPLKAGLRHCPSGLLPLAQAAITIPITANAAMRDRRAGFMCMFRVSWCQVRLLLIRDQRRSYGFHPSVYLLLTPL